MAEPSNDIGGGSKRGRGAYYSANIEKELATKKVSHLKIEFDAQTGKVIQTYDKWFNNSMAHYMCDTIPPTTLIYALVFTLMFNYKITIYINEYCFLFEAYIEEK